ncbi:MAG: hypothetical protein FHP94_06760 [Denitromonas halophila]|nr:MAG: hypothetical protein FHP94_06760 [Denitromonas halophila]TVT69020.1 MAG: hypothetical protein FHP93_14465 [Denitromonas halophila]
MKPRTLATMGVATLALTYVQMRLWLASDWSESTWSWINARLSDGADPGLASDVELIAALACTFTVSLAVVWGVRILLGGHQKD